MKHNKKIIKVKKRELTVTFIIMITMLLFFSGYSLGKAYLSTDITVNGKIAEPILVVENNPVVQIDGTNEKEYYNFKIKNTNEEGKINQIDLVYNIEIITKTEEAISFKLYKNDNEEIQLKNNKTEDIKLKKGKLQEDSYKLEIIYDKNKNHSIDDIVQDVQIKVHSEQVKI